MDISLTLKDSAMLYAFMGGIRTTGYLDNEIAVNENTIHFIFANPHSTQPHSRTKEIEIFMQKNNKQNCDTFLELTKDYGNTASKLAVIRKKDQEIYNSILSLGWPRKLYYKLGAVNKWNQL
jgi:hypothetical protein